MDKVHCDICRVYVHKNSVWKHNKSHKHINNPRYEQKVNYKDIIEIPERLFKEKRVRGFVNPIHLKKPLSDQYNLIILHHNPIDFVSELKVVDKYNQYISQIHINIIVKKRAIKYGENSILKSKLM